jgi:hypothetical protein
MSKVSKNRTRPKLLRLALVAEAPTATKKYLAPASRPLKLAVVRAADGLVRVVALVSVGASVTVDSPQVVDAWETTPMKVEPALQ